MPAGTLALRALGAALIAAGALALAAGTALAKGGGGADAPGADGVSIFFYPWYGTPARDGAYLHWAQDGNDPPARIASNFYPARGPYSSSDLAVLRSQMDDIQVAGIATIVVSWWGWGSKEDLRLPAVVAVARSRGLGVAVQIEPYAGRTPDTVVSDVEHLRTLGISTFYLFHATDLPAEAWAPANDRLRGVRVFAQTGLPGWAAAGHFTGVYTYDIVSYGARSFRRICGDAHRLGLLCAPSVGPGYLASAATGDSRIEPRLAGLTYDVMWRAALRAGADEVTITSYNEWHEGTQIEPARTAPSGSTYDDYSGAYGLRGWQAADAYIQRTAMWTHVYALRRRAQ